MGTVQGIGKSTLRVWTEKRRVCRRVMAVREARALHAKVFCQGLRRARNLEGSPPPLFRGALVHFRSRCFQRNSRQEPPPIATVMANGKLVRLNSPNRIDLRREGRPMAFDFEEASNTGPRDRERARE